MFKTTWNNPLRRGSFGYRLLVVFSLVLSILEHNVQATQNEIQPKKLRHFPVILQERDDAYEKAKAKGVGLSCEMEKSTSLASTWTDYSALDTWGWVAEPYETILQDALDDVLKALNVDTEQNVPINVEHLNQKTINSVTYFKTEATFGSVYNVPGGCIIADNSESPSTAKPGLPNYPLLLKWSDVTFLQWQKMAGGSTQNLNHIIRSIITNPVTVAIMRQALGESTTFGNWDKYAPLQSKGKSFYPGSDEYHALLGSPNGQGVAYLLTQHKAQLGVRRVSQITIFGEDNAPAMYLKIEAFTPSS